MARDDRLPVTHRLPDGDVAQVITWAFVVDQITSFMTELTTIETQINGHLTTIEHKIDEWLADE